MHPVHHLQHHPRANQQKHQQLEHRQIHLQNDQLDNQLQVRQKIQLVNLRKGPQANHRLPPQLPQLLVKIMIGISNFILRKLMIPNLVNGLQELLRSGDVHLSSLLINAEKHVKCVQILLVCHLQFQFIPPRILLA